MMKLASLCLILLALPRHVSAFTDCKAKSLDFIVQDGDALLAAIEDDVRADLAKRGINVVTRFLKKGDFNNNMTSGNFNLCFSETWGPPYDPHSFAASWKSPDEAHYAALKGMTAPYTQTELTNDITNVLSEGDLQKRQQQWKKILTELHKEAIDLPFSGKRIPTVLSKRLAGYVAGEQQYDYPLQHLQVLSGSKTITVAPGARTGLFNSIGRLDPHTYPTNEFFSSNWVYEGLVSYGANGALEPSLASSWTVEDLANGGQKYKFMLRQGVKFHDGSDWNCAAAKLNFDHVLETAKVGWHGWYDVPKQITAWTCQGTYEFHVTTKSKYYPFLQELSYIRPLRMLSPAMFASGPGTDPKTENSCHTGANDATTGVIGSAKDANGATFTVKCAGVKGVSGTGPFSYVSTETNGDVKFKANAAHWASAPKFDFLLVKKYADADAVMKALQAKTLDVMVGAGVLKPVDLKTIQTTHTSDYQVFLGPPIMNRIIIINANKAPTDDIELRKVIMHAVNKAAIIDKELYGFAEPVDALFPKNAPYCGVDLTPRWDYDDEKAGLICTVPAPTASADDDDGIKPGILILIVALVTVFCGVSVILMYMFGKRQGMLYEQLNQKQKSGGTSIGNSA